MTPAHEQLSELQQQARAVAEEWARTGRPDTLAAVRRLPDLRLDRSLLVDLAYEEYFLRTEAGEVIDDAAYCARFPECHSSIQKALKTHHLLKANESALRRALPIQRPRPGAEFHGFHIERQLGHGGLARVYLAWHAATARHVVLKVSSAASQEPRLLGALAHPNVIRVFDARVVDPATHLVVMPFVAASTLHDLLELTPPKPDGSPRENFIRRAADRNLRPDEIPADRTFAAEATAPFERALAFLGREMAKGLGYLHAHGIVHRDLKPSNVLLSWEGRPILVDFNLADRTANGGKVGGTIRYMAPEQIRAIMRVKGEPAPGPRADLFSLGVLLFELLTGCHPFGEPSSQGSNACDPKSRAYAAWLLGQHRSGPRPLTTGGSALRDIISKCLQFDETKRPEGAEIVAAALDRLVGVSAPRRVGRWNRRAAAVAMALGLIAVGGSAVQVAQRPEARSATEIELIDEAKADSPDQARADFRNGEYDTALRRLNRMLKRDSVDRDGFFLRGVARMRLREFAGAAEDFARARHQGHDDGRTDAALAYCWAQSDNHSQALVHGDSAVRRMATAAVFNNRAFSRMSAPTVSPRAEKIQSIDEDLRRAERLDDWSIAIKLNRAAWLGHVAAQRARDGDAAGADAKLVRAVDVVREVFDRRSASAATCRNGALWVVLQGHPSAADCDLAVRLIEECVRQGVDPASFAKNSRFSKLAHLSDFQQVLKSQPGPRAAVVKDQLLDPLADFVP